MFPDRVSKLRVMDRPIDEINGLLTEQQTSIFFGEMTEQNQTIPALFDDFFDYHSHTKEFIRNVSIIKLSS